MLLNGRESCESWEMNACDLPSYANLALGATLGLAIGTFASVLTLLKRGRR